ncbi:MAG: hypothetical protein RSA53_12050 [Odoribacter sp.]
MSVYLRTILFWSQCSYCPWQTIGLEGELIERNGEYHLLVRLDGWGSLLTRVAVSCVEAVG